MIRGVFSQILGTSGLVADLRSSSFCCDLGNGLGWLFGTFALSSVLLPLEFASLLNIVLLFSRIISRSAHLLHPPTVDLFSQIERWLVALTKARKVGG